jgi:hypothetical protein
MQSSVACMLNGRCKYIQQRVDSHKFHSHFQGPLRTSNAAQSSGIVFTTTAELAHRELRLLKLMPLMQSSAACVLEGTIWPPGHMQKL